MTILGKIVRSNSHTDYVCQIYGKHETAHPPSNTDYAFGTFVEIGLDEQWSASILGLVYDTVLIDPDFGRLGPRLSPESDLVVFSPDYLNERAVLIGIVAIGEIDHSGYRQGIPSLAATTGAQVRCASEETVIAFHEIGSVRIVYLPQLVQRPDNISRQLAFRTIQRLGQLLPAYADVLGVIADDLNWQLQINPMGGSN